MFSYDDVVKDYSRLIDEINGIDRNSVFAPAGEIYEGEYSVVDKSVKLIGEKK